MSSTKLEFTLDSGKKIVVRTPINQDIENAMIKTSQQVGDTDDKMLYSYKLSENIAKEILIAVNGSDDVRHPFDKLFTLPDIAQLKLVVGELSGNAKAKLPKMTVLTA